KEVSGKSTSQLINEIVVMEAKIMLDNPKLTISQIAQELQFSNQSFFGKFFKKNTGISPSNYRKI
ncbi:MAG: AraC family transcriptional regulator, partial [Flavobacteriaceae bacterium]|nr:AraC family transcriptional regulator [Flavobacteriaceae bacterium]